MVKILVACGTGIATSTMAAKKLEGELIKRGKGKLFTINQCKVAELEVKAPDYDVIVATSQVVRKIDKPIVQGLPFITGMGIDKAVDEVIEKSGL